ncbi:MULTISPECIES: ATP-binding protein [unclassified Novosphingobium]|uniref:sensor histidine kinase n=1 Tax=unclassified Novosphingobium TaxID=2644732 RepID=UPI0025F78A27|nr:MULTISPECIES: ATP-binding protein [unclassified Novosphingobium]HQS68084.1 ATP-binding protein [Novosphingobium sp.]
MNELRRWLIETGMPPHGYCLLWQPDLLALHVISDLVIGLAYFSIPVALAVYLIRRKDMQFTWMIWLFAAFILACGTTHFLSILVLWVPAYGLEGVVKAFTAIVSIGTAILIWPLLPKLLALPSPAQLQRLNDQLLKEAEERAAVESQLRQAQKMEALGQLTGGIAHDFNNLLMIVSGNVERALRIAPQAAPERRNLENALTATTRAGELTGQLLAFARKGTLMLIAQNVESIVTGIHDLLVRAAGERIVVEVAIAPDLPPVVVDRNQLENAVLNLVINARDATPDGGVIRIAAQDAGAEIRLSVSDTGAGMDAQTLHRATEPFFTTKPVGSGSGLGLSQVYGFVEQIGGRMEIVSEPGTGTVVTLYLPKEAVRDVADIAG